MMRYIDQLLHGAEVEWKKLGEVCQFKNGFAFMSSLFKESGLPIIRIGNIIENSVSMNDVAFFDPKDYKKGNPLSYTISRGDILIAMSGATTGKIGYYNNEELAYLNQRVGKFIPNPIILNNRFLYHFLLTQSDYFYRLSLGGAQPNLSSNDLMERVLIPIPPLHVQQEIVRILDKFTELETELEKELETELELRKQQYERYRDQLLAPDKGLAETEVEWKKLGEVCSIKTGKGITKKDAATDGRYPIISGGKTPMGYIDVFNRQANTVTVSRVGANAGFVSYIMECFYLNDKCFSAVPKESCLVIGRFLYYALKSQEKRLSALQSEGGVPTINTRKLGSILIPIPPLHVQQRIVSLLDKFHTLTTSISEGLPRELELRKQQYAYYRDQLLAFER